MTNYTDKEKAALAGMLSVIIYADGFIDMKEVDYMGRIKYRLNISDDLLEQGLNMDREEILDILSSMDEPGKQLAGKIFIKMAHGGVYIWVVRVDVVLLDNYRPPGN